MWWGVGIVGCTVTLFTVRRVSFTQTILITAALLGRIATVWRPSIVPICLLLNHPCIRIVSNCYIGLRFSPVLYVTNFLANVWYLWGKQLYLWHPGFPLWFPLLGLFLLWLPAGNLHPLYECRQNYKILHLRYERMWKEIWEKSHLVAGGVYIRSG